MTFDEWWDKLNQRSLFQNLSDLQVNSSDLPIKALARAAWQEAVIQERTKHERQI